MSGAKKLVFSVISSMFLIYFIWLIIGSIKYGENIIYYHLDLETTIKQFRVDFDISSFHNTFNGFIQAVKTVNTSNPIFKQILAWFNNARF